MAGSFHRTQSPGPTVASAPAAPSLAPVAASLPQRHPPRAGKKLLQGSTGREAAAASWVLPWARWGWAVRGGAPTATLLSGGR